MPQTLAREYTMLEADSTEDLFRRAKYRDYFRCLDRDNNGVLELRDFELVVKRLMELAPALVSNPPLLREAYSDLWTHIIELMDVNADGVVSEDEFVEFFVDASALTIQEEEVPDWAVQHVKMTLAALDLDGDGTVSLPEYANYLHAIGSDAKYELAFACLDSDDDGRLDLGEISQLFGEWLTAGQPERPGNYLVTGRLPS